MKILHGKNYAQELIRSIDSAHDSITLATMVSDAEGLMNDIFTALHAARKRGVAVTFYLDVFTKFQIVERLKPLEGRRIYNRLLEHLAALEHEGAHIVWLGKLGFNPYMHRFHQKISIIDNTVFFAGGINLTGESFTFHDYMVQTEKSALANLLTSQLQRIAKHGYIDDEVHQFTPSSTLLIDGGIPKHSVIYDQALRQASEAKEIIFVSQMAPSGKLAKILQQKPTTFYLNSPANMSPVGGASEFITQKYYQYKNSHHKKQYIHAKYMLFTMKNGEKRVLTGSHNFNERGVNYGTKEIALLTKDDTIWRALARYAKNGLN